MEKLCLREVRGLPWTLAGAPICVAFASRECGHFCDISCPESSSCACRNGLCVGIPFRAASVGSSLLLLMMVLVFQPSPWSKCKTHHSGPSLCTQELLSRELCIHKQGLDDVHVPLCGFSTFSDGVLIVVFCHLIGAAKRSCKCVFSLTISEYRWVFKLLANGLFKCQKWPYPILI